jgi:hypothetical protein
MNDNLTARIESLAERSEAREAQHLSRLRSDALACGFTRFFADCKSVFGPGTRCIYFEGRSGSWGKAYPAGVTTNPIRAKVKVKRA